MGKGRMAKTKAMAEQADKVKVRKIDPSVP